MNVSKKLRNIFMLAVLAGAIALVLSIVLRSPEALAPAEIDESHVQQDEAEGVVSTAVPEHSNPRRFDPKDKLIDIVFPDGESIAVTKSYRQRPGITYPENISEVYHDLRARAESGDADAAYELGQLLQHCMGAPRSEDEVKAWVEQLYTTRELFVQREDEGFIFLDVGEELGLGEKEIKKRFRQCKSISDGQIAEAEHWTEMALENGHEYARSHFPGEYRRSGKGYELTKQMWASGDIGTLDRLASYHSGLFADDIVVPDRLKAYAYTYLSAQFYFDDLETWPGPSSRRLRRETQEEVDRLAAQLSPFELEQAQELAKSILRENRNCCFEWYQ